MSRFTISAAPLALEALLESLADPRAGAVVTFEGRVRNHHGGRPVLALEYEAYLPLALKEGERVLDEARARFDILRLACAHRIGHLALGEPAVWVGVAAAHREAAFAATRLIIDEIKARVPIWKKEFYGDGTTAWVRCDHARAATPPGREASRLGRKLLED